MRITYVSAVHDTRDTRVFDRMCVSLAKRHRVVMLARHPHNECVQGVRIKALPTFRSRLARMTIGSLCVFVRALLTPTDVYITVPPENLWVALALKVLTSRCVLHEMHEHFELEIAGNRHYLPPRLVGCAIRTYRKVWSYVAPRLDGLIAATPRIGKEIVLLNPNTFTINNFPKLVDEEPASLNERERAVCYVGKMCPNRGLAELITATEHGDFKLHLVGGFDPPEWERELRALPGWANVVYHGFLPFEEAKTVMRRCGAGIITFLPGGQNELSFPNKMFEYMAMGLPIVSSNFAEWIELVGEDAAVFVDPTDPEAVAQGVADILGHPDRAAEMIAAGRKLHRERFNWSSEEQRLWERLERTCRC